MWSCHLRCAQEMRTAADKQHEIIQNFLELRVCTTQLNYLNLSSTQHSSL